MNNTNGRKIILTSIAIMIMLLATLAASYAFFAGSAAGNAKTNILVRTNSIDQLILTPGNTISIVANQDNFAQGAGNLSGSTTSTAQLTASDASSTIHRYRVYLFIETNGYTYTTAPTNTPELTLTVTKNGTPVVSSMDITTKRGGVDIPVSTSSSATIQTISANAGQTTTDTWVATVTFVNLNSNQNDNVGKEFSARLIIEEVNNLASEKCTSGSQLNNCIASLYSEDGADSLYQHSSGKSTSAEDGSIRYAGINPNNYVCFGASSCTSTDDHLYRIIGVIPVTLASGGTQNLVKLIKADYANTGIIGTGNEYVYDSEPGGYYLGNQSAISKYFWSRTNWATAYNETGAYNLWSYSALNTANLNDYYLNTYLGNTWKNKIENVKWIVAGNTESNILSTSAKYTYQNEIVNPNPGSYGNGETTYDAKVGLVYVSDYAYAKDTWATSINTSNLNINNWMNAGFPEWSITRKADSTSYVFVVSQPYLGVTTAVGNSSTIIFDRVYSQAVRPVLYLTASTTYVGGSGTASDPIIIN